MARVLVVDDDTTVREVVVSYLRAAGHEVVDVGDGESGLAVADVDHLVARGAEVGDHDLAHGGVVVNDQDPSHRPSSSSPLHARVARPPGQPPRPTLVR